MSQRRRSRRIAAAVIGALAAASPSLATAEPEGVAGDACDGGEVAPEPEGAPGSTGDDDAAAEDAARAATLDSADLESLKRQLSAEDAARAAALESTLSDPVGAGAAGAGEEGAAAGAPEADGPLPVRLGGYVQPQVRVRQDSAADQDTDGFRFRRARLTLRGARRSGPVELGVDVEAELTPEFTLLDAYVHATGALPAGGSWRVDLGQARTPYARQNMLSDSALQFVEKAELASLAPDRQIGLRAAVELPGLPMVTLRGGVFNGEGRNQVQNIDQNVMLVGRVEVRPVGRGAPLQESAFVDHVTLGASVFGNTLDIGDALEDVRGLGVDLAAAWRGLSVAAEYAQTTHAFPDAPSEDYRGNGVAVQAGWLLPLPGWWARRLEVAARFEEIDRNDAVFVDNPGDPNQSARLFTAAASYYHARHDLKVQLAASHIVEIEDRSRTGADITYPNDLLLLQVSFRME